MVSYMKGLSLAVLLAGLGGTYVARAADTEPNATMQQAETKVYEAIDKDSTVIRFKKDSATLSAADKASINALAAKSKADADVDRLIVAAWSDKDYPVKGQSLSGHERTLADRRKDAVAKLLKNDGTKTVDTFSFAEHPAWLAKVFNTENAKIKGEGGKVHSGNDEMMEHIGARLRDKGGPGTAVIIIKYKNDAMAH